MEISFHCVGGDGFPGFNCEAPFVCGLPVHTVPKNLKLLRVLLRFLLARFFGFFCRIINNPNPLSLRLSKQAWDCLAERDSLVEVESLPLCHCSNPHGEDWSSVHLDLSLLHLTIYENSLLVRQQMMERIILKYFVKSHRHGKPCPQSRAFVKKKSEGWTNSSLEPIQMFFVQVLHSTHYNHFQRGYIAPDC